MRDDVTVLVTGAAGSIGSSLCYKLLGQDLPFRVTSLRALDCNENALFFLEQRLGCPALRCLLGDIRDKDRLRLAMRGADYVFHLAALKNIAVTEHSPFELLATNALGTWNVIHAAIEEYATTKMMLVSTDKAVRPTSLYGLTKAVDEKLVEWAHLHQDETVFGTARLGNVWNTSGSVAQVWAMQRHEGRAITVTDRGAKRFFYMKIRQASDFIVRAFCAMQGGEIFVPGDMEEKDMYDLALSFGDRIIETGLRRGEKLCEELMTEEEKESAEELDGMWVIRPPANL